MEVLQFDEKNSSFYAKIVIAFSCTFPHCAVGKFQKFSPTWNFFRQIDIQYKFLVTVWKSTRKCDRDFCVKTWIFSVKLKHFYNMLILPSKLLILKSKFLIFGQIWARSFNRFKQRRVQSAIWYWKTWCGWMCSKNRIS